MTTDDLGGLHFGRHRWFAWRPIWTPTRGWQWLRYVEREWVVKFWLPGPLANGFWEYGP